jgi:hypothetical protein
VKSIRPTWRHADIAPLRVRYAELLRLREYVQRLEGLRSGVHEGGPVLGGISLTLDRRRQQPLHVVPLPPNGNSAEHLRRGGRKPGT